MTRSRLLRRWSGYLYALPYLTLFGLFLVLPLLYGLRLSLFRWEMLSRLQPRFAGLGNYAEAVHDPYFWKSLVATLKFVALAVPLTVCLALLIAVGLKSLPGRRQAFYRAAYFTPTIPPSVWPASSGGGSITASSGCSTSIWAALESRFPG